MKLSEAAQRLQKEGSTADSEAVGRLARAKGVETVGEALALSLSDMRQGAQLHGTAATVAFRARLAACVASPVCTGAAALADDRARGTWITEVRAWARESAVWGAFAFGHVVELAGESGAGKTQLALQLAIDVQRAVPGAEAAYVCTEGPFPSTRFEELAAVAAASASTSVDDTGAFGSDGRRERGIRQQQPRRKGTSFGERLHVRNATATGRRDIRALFSETERLCMARGGAVRLVVVDSIAALFRGEYARSEAVERAAVLADVARTLHRIAAHGACVLVLNQVTDVLDSDVPGDAGREEQTLPAWTARDAVEPGAGMPWHVRRTAPALSLGWAAAVNTRLMLSCTLEHSARRVLQVVWCPTVAKGAWVPCVVDAEGVHPPRAETE